VDRQFSSPALLIAPHFNAHDLAVLIIPAAFAVQALRRSGSMLVEFARDSGWYLSLVALTFGNQLPGIGAGGSFGDFVLVCLRLFAKAAAYADDQPQGAESVEMILRARGVLPGAT